jgi:hypothetical protein
MEDNQQGLRLTHAHLLKLILDSLQHGECIGRLAEVLPQLRCNICMRQCNTRMRQCNTRMRQCNTRMRQHTVTYRNTVHARMNERLQLARPYSMPTWQNRDGKSKSTYLQDFVLHAQEFFILGFDFGFHRCSFTVYV